MACSKKRMKRELKHRSKEYHCHNCPGRKFYSKESINYHNREVHRGFLFQCGICGNVFKFKADLIIHNSSPIHNKKKVEIEDESGETKISALSAAGIEDKDGDGDEEEE